jgi:hypothetical protein
MCFIYAMIKKTERNVYLKENSHTDSVRSFDCNMLTYDQTELTYVNHIKINNPLNPYIARFTLAPRKERLTIN